MTERVLLIEDDADIALGVRTVLSRNGFAVMTAGDGREGLRAFHGERPDIVILDVGLPEMDGWTVLERIRELSEVPVLMLTAHGHESDKVRGLRTGADDYVTKPFGNAEFVARVQALLRRAGNGDEDTAELYDDGRVRVDFAAHEVVADGVPVELTATEYRLLAALVRHRGQVLSAARLLDLVWNDPAGVGPDRVKYSVMRLRRKLGAGPGPDSPIEAVRGFGYRYRADRSRAARLRQPARTPPARARHAAASGHAPSRAGHAHPRAGGRAPGRPRARRPRVRAAALARPLLVNADSPSGRRYLQ